MRVLMLSGWYCGPEGLAYPGDEVAVEDSEAIALVKAGRAKPIDFEVELEPWETPLRRPNMPIMPRMRKRNRRW